MSTERSRSRAGSSFPNDDIEIEKQSDFFWGGEEGVRDLLHFVISCERSSHVLNFGH